MRMQQMLLVLIIATTTIHSTILDDIKSIQASHAYSASDYNKSYSIYKSISTKDDKLLYNIANTLYMQKHYDRALATYQQISSPDLSFATYHNIANCYIRLDRPRKAILYYQAALSLHYDQDTALNLNYAQKLIKTQQQKILKNRHSPLAKNTTMDDTLADKPSSTEPISTWNKAPKSTKSLTNNSKLKTHQDSMISSADSQDINRTTKSDHKATLSIIEQQKWDTKLSDIELKSLLVPLDFKGDYDDSKPW